ncbi:hypothetical protein BTN49_1814 [Candidatus Enterovibrio escicola]|uniref:Uncharacterized protein n=1 Tax=Candidatus Enterovibrio escicola TaxID=1927127 RepID=A0A2A5T342_9GAMM|nr:hypothetical protein BTN49_1814 [Candidatus Enterovibrio escacola]
MKRDQVLHHQFRSHGARRLGGAVRVVNVARGTLRIFTKESGEKHGCFGVGTLLHRIKSTE